MMSIFFDLIEHCIAIYMDDFCMYGSSFDDCLANLSQTLDRCILNNLVLSYEKCHFFGVTRNSLRPYNF